MLRPSTGKVDAVHLRTNASRNTGDNVPWPRLSLCTSLMKMPATCIAGIVVSKPLNREGFYTDWAAEVSKPASVRERVQSQNVVLPTATVCGKFWNPPKKTLAPVGTS